MDPLTGELLEIIRLTEQAASQLHGLEDPQKIFDAVTGVFRESKRYNAHILLADGEDPALRFVASSFSPALVRLGELVAGVTMNSFRVDLNRASLLARVFRHGETIQVPTTEVLGDFLPSSVGTSVLRRMKYEGTVDMLTPLHRNGETIGILSLTAPELANEFVPSLKNLAHQIGATLQFVESQRERKGIETRYRDLLENLNEIIYSIDAEGRITFVSSSVALMGRSPDELLGQPVDAIFEGADLEVVRAWLAEFLDGTRVTGEAELRVSRSADEVRWIRTSSRAILESGRAVGVRGSLIDITQEKAASEALVESERRLSTLMSNLEGMVYRCKNLPSWTMEFVSEGCRNLTGYAPEDLVEDRTLSYGSLILPEDRDTVWREVQEGLASGRPFGLSYRIRSADGTVKWVWEQGRGVRLPGGDFVALEGFISDVSEQYRVAETLRSSEERLNLALDATSDGLWDWDGRTGLTYYSPRYYTMLGYAPDEFPATREEWFKRLHPDDLPAAIAATQELGEHGDSLASEFRMQAKDGSWRWILSRGRVVERNPAGEALRVIGTHVDITKRKADAEALERALAGTIRVITQAAEARDPYTAGHQQRVAALAYRIATELGLTEDQQNGLLVAGLLHDVGKISVPSEILAKPGRLSEVELRLVQGHVEAGYQILEGIDFPWPVAETVLQHHERLDGAGYPHAMSGDAICLEARILAVSDTVEAMSMHRPYRPALGTDAALEQIERDRGTAYDPEVVDACLRLFREKDYSLDDSPESDWTMLRDLTQTRT